MANGSDMRRLRLGSCPDSWGVWFADDPRQTPWKRFLDELAGAGYRWLELGPYGYLPTDPAQLRDELAARDLQVAGGTLHGFSGLHRPNDFDTIVAQTRRVSALTAAVEGKHLIFVPVPGYRDDITGAYLAPAELDADEWRTMIGAVDVLGRIVAEEYGLTLQFHPHADYHVETQEQTERFLDDTEPRFVSLCLDTGHLAYRRADVPGLIRKYPDANRLRAHQADGSGDRRQGRTGGPGVRASRCDGRELHPASWTSGYPGGSRRVARPRR